MMDPQTQIHTKPCDFESSLYLALASYKGGNPLGAITAREILAHASATQLESVVSAITIMLAISNTELQLAAAASVKKLGIKALPALTNLSRIAYQEATDVAVASIEAVSAIPHEDALQALTAILKTWKDKSNIIRHVIPGLAHQSGCDYESENGPLTLPRGPFIPELITSSHTLEKQPCKLNLDLLAEGDAHPKDLYAKLFHNAPGGTGEVVKNVITIEVDSTEHQVGIEIYNLPGKPNIHVVVLSSEEATLSSPTKLEGYIERLTTAIQTVYALPIDTDRTIWVERAFIPEPRTNQLDEVLHRIKLSYNEMNGQFEVPEWSKIGCLPELFISLLRSQGVRD